MKLKEIYPQLDNYLDNLIINVGDETQETEFYYDENGWEVYGTIRSMGDYEMDGDGYWTPREPYLTQVRSDITIESAGYIPEGADDYEYMANDTELKELERHLQDALGRGWYTPYREYNEILCTI